MSLKSNQQINRISESYNTSMDSYHNVMQDFIEPNWKGLFPQHVIPSKSIKCSKSFYQYLIADGVFIHSDYCRDKSQQLVKGQALLFPEIQEIVKQALKQYQTLFVKINWKSAKDCKSWIGGLECTHIEDVMKAIKCSSYIAQTLEDYQDLYPQHLHLILKRYEQLDRNFQFRCFVNNQVISICQRSTEHVFLDIQNQDQYEQRITKFITQTIIPRVNKEKYVIDLYVPKKGPIKIIDLSPWRQFTNPLLYNWEQLQSKQEGELRLVSSHDEIMYEDLGNYNKPNEEEMKWLAQEILGYQP